MYNYFETFFLIEKCQISGCKGEINICNKNKQLVFELFTAISMRLAYPQNYKIVFFGRFLKSNKNAIYDVSNKLLKETTQTYSNLFDMLTCVFFLLF